MSKELAALHHLIQKLLEIAAEEGRKAIGGLVGVPGVLPVAADLKEGFCRRGRDAVVLTVRRWPI